MHISTPGNKNFFYVFFHTFSKPSSTSFKKGISNSFLLLSLLLLAKAYGKTSSYSHFSACVCLLAIEMMDIKLKEWLIEEL